MRVKIFIIEDMCKDATTMLDLLKQSAAKIGNEENKFTFEWLEGEDKATVESETHKYYTDNILNVLEREINKSIRDNFKVGILLDIVLTREEDIKSKNSLYPYVDLAKKIYFKYENEIPMYLITSYALFAIASDTIMGKDLSQCYATKSDLKGNDLSGSDFILEYFTENLAKMENN